MNDWRIDNSRNPAGPAGFVMLVGVAVAAAAAYLLATRPGQQIRQQIADRASGWTAQAADALAQSREKIISSVEQETVSQDGPVRQKPA